jgi:tetratricopeptide (TPR) repeat protein
MKSTGFARSTALPSRDARHGSGEPCYETHASQRSVTQCARGSALALAIALLISAAPLASPEDLVRQGNLAFERGGFEEALLLYQQAEERGTDPGLIAFNEAAAYYHLKDYRRAESHFRMALDDGDMSLERRGRALYNLGNCLMQQAGETDVKTLRAAIGCYERALRCELDDGLRRDAAHNLELAKLLWNKARSKLTDPPPPNTEEPPENERRPEPKKKTAGASEPGAGPDESGKGPKKQQGATAEKDPNGKATGKEEPDQVEQAPSKLPSHVRVVPDTDVLVDLSPEEARRFLSDAEKRLRKERASNRTALAIPEKPSGRDW